MSAAWNWPGSRWWRVDLHTHSPASYDFKPDADRSAKDWVAWVSAARSAGLHAVALTDHNTAQGVDALRQAVAAVADAPVILPGVEITASDGTHLLYNLCERKKRAAEALSYNGLVQSWPEISRLARAGSKPRAEQGGLFRETEE